MPDKIAVNRSVAVRVLPSPDKDGLHEVLYIGNDPAAEQYGNDQDNEDQRTSFVEAFEVHRYAVSLGPSKFSKQQTVSG